MHFLKLVRYPNLLIVVLTQFLFYWFILEVFGESTIHPVLDFFHLSLLVLTKVLIAAGGYVINDIYDFEIDQVNKPDRMVLNNSISLPLANKFYALVIILGGGIAAYLAVHVGNRSLFLIYPVAVFLMWWYSKSLKQQPLSGNLIVALFAAFVPGIVWFAEREGFARLTSDFGQQMRSLFLFYMVFAFISTLFREVIKDIEDYKGDIDNGCRTLPIVLGIEKARLLCFAFGGSLIAAIIYWMVSQWQELGLLLIVLTITFLLVPSLYSIWKLKQSKTKSDYHQSSQISKGIMVLGLLYLFVFLLAKN